MTACWKATFKAAAALPRRAAIAAIKAYHFVISPLVLVFVGPQCRFDPTCSAYAHDAIAVHGLIRGGWLAAKRLARCRPGGGWGYDPVPDSAGQLLKH